MIEEGDTSFVAGDMIWEDDVANVEDEIEKFKSGEYEPGVFSEFGFRRRLSGEAQDYFIKRMTEEKIPGFMGTSDVYFAKKYNVEIIPGQRVLLRRKQARRRNLLRMQAQALRISSTLRAAHFQ